MPATDQEDWPGLDPTEPTASLSRHVLMRADEEDLILKYEFPTDTRDPRQYARLRRALGDEVPMPAVDSGTYYLVHIADAKGKRCKVVFGEGEVLSSIFTLALITRGAEYAATFAYRRGQLS